MLASMQASWVIQQVIFLNQQVICQIQQILCFIMGLIQQVICWIQQPQNGQTAGLHQPANKILSNPDFVELEDLAILWAFCQSTEMERFQFQYCNSAANCCTVSGWLVRIDKKYWIDGVEWSQKVFFSDFTRINLVNKKTQQMWLNI